LKEEQKGEKMPLILLYFPYMSKIEDFEVDNLNDVACEVYEYNYIH